MIQLFKLRSILHTPFATHTEWSPWDDWSSCSETCGPEAYRTRSKHCQDTLAGNAEVDPSHCHKLYGTDEKIREIEDCGLDLCPSMYWPRVV